jgi:hypothetical protein
VGIWTSREQAPSCPSRESKTEDEFGDVDRDRSRVLGPTRLMRRDRYVAFFLPLIQLNDPFAILLPTARNPFIR